MIETSTFNTVIGKFDMLESFRGQLYKRALSLIENNKKHGIEGVEAFVDAYVLILATWNSGYMRYVMGGKYEDFHATLEKAELKLKSLEGKEFQNMDFSANNKENTQIKDVFDKLKDNEMIRYTGASKIMHLRLPKLFVMWDRFIGEDYEKDGAGYLKFLKDMKNKFSSIPFKEEEHHTFAKAVDEYNYITITIPKLQEANIRDLKKKISDPKTKPSKLPELKSRLSEAENEYKDHKDWLAKVHAIN